MRRPAVEKWEQRPEGSSNIQNQNLVATRRGSHPNQGMTAALHGFRGFCSEQMTSSMKPEGNGRFWGRKRRDCILARPIEHRTLSCLPKQTLCQGSANKLLALAVLASATSITVCPLSSATRSATDTTKAGSFLLPRRGTGARNGQSVSTRNRSCGTSLAQICVSTAFGNVTVPLKLM